MKSLPNDQYPLIWYLFFPCKNDNHEGCSGTFIARNKRHACICKCHETKGYKGEQKVDIHGDRK